ncbi:subtilisin-like protease [Zingiber officinale]|uniref:subtilisin-like protease n=1 Tax=Zingiber officinale TaxID=94328 RepID=UPI001C4D7E31|nr:subtilisin-like protease [Zingiber officinale]
MDLAPWLLFFLLAFFSNPTVASPSSSVSRYIIQVEEPIEPLTERSLKRWHESFLPPAVEASGVDRRLLHSYSDVFSGFTAMLTEEELQAMGKKKGFVRAFPDRVLHVMTTHTPDFLGLKVGSKGLWKDSKLGRGVIIGVLDTGVTPGHPSYDDEGVPPPPSTWKGSCNLETGCNNKLIGARSMIVDGDERSPVDEVGHGTHTSATAAGNFVRNVSYFGFAKGTAAGMAPQAHLAIYQVCTAQGCNEGDILAGLDAAVKDGVDILSLSLGGGSMPLDEDVVAIGSFAAVRKGIFVSCAGGNDGPDYFTLSNEAPWILTVAASSVDRSFRASVKLPNGKVIPGESLDQPRNFPKSSLPLYYSTESPSCDIDPPDDSHRGSVWVCEVRRGDLGRVVAFAKSHGARALISISSKIEGATISIRKMNFPGVVLTIQEGSHLISYLNSTSEPSALIVFNGTVLGVSPAPVVAFFSSRGPSQATPGILKPDISGPGLNIFAAYIHSRDTPDQYYIISGTSMATPHLSGVAALLKAAHPTWSPAAIRSAIITTADTDVSDELLELAPYFVKGAGHINPNKATNPGLIYNITDDDYVSYICDKFGKDGARNIARTVVDCSKRVAEEELNYPSILLAPKGGAVAKVTRTVTNVGPAKSSYTVSVSISKTAVLTSVTPKTLTFNELNEQKSFTVSAKWGVGGPPTSGNQFVEGKLTWTSDDNKYVVTSPFVVSALECCNASSSLSSSFQIYA